MTKVLKDSTVSVRVTGELRAELEKIAEAEDRPLLAVMRRALLDYVERFKHEQAKSRKS